MRLAHEQYDSVYQRWVYLAANLDEEEYCEWAHDQDGPEAIIAEVTGKDDYCNYWEGWGPDGDQIAEMVEMALFGKRLSG